MIWDKETRSWVYDTSDPKEWEQCLSEWIGSREYAVELLRKAKGWEQCNDDIFTYYACVVGNQRLMYRRNTMRTDGRKMVGLKEGLARLLMWDDLEGMKYTRTSIKYGRGWGSAERLNQALERYVERMK